MTAPGALRVRCHEVAGFAPLAWCAQLRVDDPVVDVVHGTLVETTATAWFEGVWDGEFGAWGAATSIAAMGSGGALDRGRLHVVAPSHTYESLVCLRAPDRLWLSNSIACAFACADDGPRLDHASYHRELLALQRRGITGHHPVVLPTARGRRLELHAATDLVVSAALDVEPMPRPQPPEPTDFAAYRALLTDTMHRLVANARDAARTHPLRVATTTSTGYDSPACSVLAAEAGVRDSITFDRDRRGVPADCGRDIAERLGLRPHVYDTTAWRRRTGHPELEFVAAISGWAMLPLAALADDWRAAMVVTGNLGDDLWRADRQDVGPALARPHEQEPAAAGLREFRLHAGIVFVHLPTVGAVHADAIHRIGRSAELAPWRLDREYDRPIPRRIVEDAGVPRDAFGQTSWNTIDVQSRDLAARLRTTTFGGYVDRVARSLHGIDRWRLLAEWYVGDSVVEASVRAAARWWGRAHRARLAPVEHAMRASVGVLTRWQWHSSRSVQYTFHWANTVLAARYRAALDARGGVVVTRTARTRDVPGAPPGG